MSKIDYNKKLVKYRIGKSFLVFLTVLAVIGLVAWYYFGLRTKVYDRYEVTYTIPIKNVSEASWVSLGNNILYYTMDGAICMSDDGEKIWSQSYELKNPIVDICGKTAVIAENKGTKLYLVNDEEVIKTIDAGMPIKDFSVSETGLIAVVLEDDDVTWINLLDSQGEKVADFKTTMTESGYPIEIELSPQGTLMSVSFMTIDDLKIRSQVAFYNFGEVGQNKSEMLVSAYEYSDAIVPFIKFMDDINSFSIADNRLTAYEGEQIPGHNGEMLISDKIQGVYSSDKNVGLLFYNQDEVGKYRFKIYDKKASLINEIVIDIDFNEIIMDKDNIIVYNNSEIGIWNINGRLVYEGEYAKNIDKLLVTSKSTKFVVITDETLEKIKLY